ncbi:Vesicle membrane receptor protein (v-SNARE) [Entomophthora muscae]|uniref:Vesicle membrane receptor protein (V-SNARE) n=1 Tax=Entomophthora muscae TaxID=34485 RepID=A0ACC2TH53_9FUNG|nr:Vesicle membrane receptor protein (v-SNARE) [Entomophthora muscae]
MLWGLRIFKYIDVPAHILIPWHFSKVSVERLSNQGSTGDNGPQVTSKTRIIQQQVDEVVGIMQDNVEKVMEKQERLETLNDKADALNDNSMQFKRGANKVRKAMWWKDLKLKIIIGVIVLIIIIAIILACTLGSKGKA